MIELSTLLKPVVLLFVVTYTTVHFNIDWNSKTSTLLFGDYKLVPDTITVEVITTDTAKVNRIIKNNNTTKVDTFVLTPYKH